MDEPRPDWSRVARRVRVPLGFVFAILYFWLARPNWTSIGVGVLLIVPGLLLRAMASGHVSKNETLAVSGPYAYTRNPLYLGSLLLGVGFAVAGRSVWVGVLLVLMFFAIYIPVIRGEEKFLKDKFPGFEEYSARVPRVFPRLRLQRTSNNQGDASFSAHLYLKHREYQAAVGTIIILVVLVIKMTWLR
ncbi:MAG TPA: isoprenylcysteine carboxylmethyltransferase family protein [Candidatus Sulfotelmatobacter sp.]